MIEQTDEQMLAHMIGDINEQSDGQVEMEVTVTAETVPAPTPIVAPDQLLYGETQQEYLSRCSILPPSERDVKAMMSKLRQDYDEADRKASDEQAFAIAASLITGQRAPSLRKATIHPGGLRYNGQFHITIDGEQYDIAVQRVIERDIEAEARSRTAEGERAPDAYYRWLPR